MDVRIGESGRYQSSGVIVSERIDTRVVGCDKSIVTDFLITGHTVSDTQFEIVHQEVIFREPVFLRNTPSQRYGRECSPSVVLTKAGRAVTTYGSRQEVFVFV